MTQILRYINDLYTVYTNLFVYATAGTILAVSNPEEQARGGAQLHEEWVPQTLGLSNSQAYSVSKFEPTHLYGGKLTYIYGAVITEPNSNKVCGGIGVVFDSAPQFESMLKDSLPQDEFGEPKKGLVGFFLNRKGCILSSSSEDWKPGNYLKLPDVYLKSPNGEGNTGIWELNGKYFAVGSRVSVGYREFKCGDRYHNDVIAVTLAPLANAAPLEEQNQRTECSFRYDNENSSNSDDTVEVATFYVGEKTLGFQTKFVCGAVTKEGLTTISGSNKLLAGKIAYEGKAVPVISLGELTQESGTPHKSQKIIVIESDRGRIGLLVDGLGKIPLLSRDAVDFNASLLDESDKYTEGVVMPKDCSDHSQLIVLLDANRLGSYTTSKKDCSFWQINPGVKPVATNAVASGFTPRLVEKRFGAKPFENRYYLASCDVFFG